MEIARKMGGYSLGGADLLRRAMGKKQKDAMDAEKPNFLEGAEKNGVNKKTAVRVWDFLEKFANYGFNKSHAAAYAVLSYQTAWLKANYPVEFMAAVMNCDIHLTEKLTLYKQEIENLRFGLNSPCINKSDAYFSVFDFLDRDHKTNGGSNETDEKLLAVTPKEMLRSTVVTTVTPVEKHPIADLKSKLLIYLMSQKD